ncbi:hypothetical protein GLU64_02470 [Nanohaloarchaea archaeon]|nr:hypothetical protein [Candidatus Nanohaloarchaea archaeon]
METISVTRENIKQHYKENRKEVENRLEEFSDLRGSSDKRKFNELVFVILTSQTEAQKAWEASKKLVEQNISEEKTSEIADLLERCEVSYPESKAEYIKENKSMLSQPTLTNPKHALKINSRIDEEDLEKTRRWFAENIKGISWKGSSHFLRNIGYGNGFAIISSHIPSQMYELGLTEDPDLPEEYREYVEQEQKLREFSEDIGIDIKALDLVLWSMRTGEIFK